ncbi:hypothetical protein ACLB2K_023189 [Fragaria x ananassa]
MFKFLTKCLVGADVSNSPKIAESGYAMLDRWLALQLLPTVKIGVLQPLEENFLHSFAYPSFLVSGDYNKLYKFIEEHGKEVVNIGQTEFRLSKEEAIHNLLFVLGFNAFGGFSVFFPSLVNAIASDTTGLQQRIVKEVRENAGSTLSFESVKDLPLVQSLVYETLRLNPLVPLQFARARKDFQLSSHDSAFNIKKGELLCGFQTQVMRDENIFDDPETFKPDRFLENKELLNCLYSSPFVFFILVPFCCFSLFCWIKIPFKFKINDDARHAFWADVCHHGLFLLTTVGFAGFFPSLSESAAEPPS